jgi:hypothetical protein
MKISLPNTTARNPKKFIRIIMHFLHVSIDTKLLFTKI